jgi:anthranilate phosphoribosyltransferase
MLQEIMLKLKSKQDLTLEEAYSIIEVINNDQLSDVQINEFQAALLMKGPALKDITVIAQAMHKLCINIKPNVEGKLMDTCGTGGGLSTFNISTAVAFVAAAAGIPVAKYGSRSISNLSGSADVMEALGAQINQSPRGVEKMIEEAGIAFLYAPLFHPIMGKLFNSKKYTKIKTIFYTIIGPLINPARASMHLMGVYKPELLNSVSKVAASLGYTHALFVHGEDGLDEISLLGRTRVYELHSGVINYYEITPEEFGFVRCKLSDIATGTPEANAVMIKDVFSGKDKGPRRQAVVFNSAGALMIAGKASDFKEGIMMAKEIIDSGAAQNKLNQMIEASHAFKNVK